jgi:type I restriction enzyme, S subunit
MIQNPQDFRHSEIPEHSGSDFRKDSRGGFKPYPAYKDSGVEWLGEVPESWTVIPLKYIGKAVIGLTYSPDDVVDEGMGTLVLRANNIQGGRLVKGDCVYVDAYISDKLQTKVGDILICSRNGSRNLIGKNAVVTSEFAGHSFGAFTTTFRSQYNQYLSYIFNSSLFTFQSSLFLTSTINQLTTGTLNSFKVPLPPLPEQEKIAAFLDFETGRMDVLIQKQERLIELLKEKRQALADIALDLDQKDWRRFSSVVMQASRPVNRDDSEIHTPVGMYNRGRGIFKKEEKESDDLGDSNFHFIHDGDLLLSGQFAWEGAVALVTSHEHNCICSHRYPIFVPKTDSVLVEYLYAFLQTKYGDMLLNENSRGAAGRNRPLNSGSLLKEKIPVPSKELQNRIAKLVRAERVIGQKVEIMKQKTLERRTALISAAVTGKIDVREWHAKAVYSEASQPEALRMVAEDGAGYAK